MPLCFTQLRFLTEKVHSGPYVFFDMVDGGFPWLWPVGDPTYDDTIRELPRVTIDTRTRPMHRPVNIPPPPLKPVVVVVRRPTT